MKHKMVRNFRASAVIALLIALLFGSGCQHARVRFDACNGECAPVTSSPQATFHAHFFAGGLFPGERTINVGSVCAEGVLEIHEYTSWLNGLVDNITHGIYAPKALAVYCK